MRHQSPANQQHHDEAKFWDRVADKAASKIGSWVFIAFQATFTVVWLTLNSVHGWVHWDSYPYVLLNLCYSFQAGFTGPVLLLANNRQSQHDRLVAEETYATGENVRQLLVENTTLTKALHDHIIGRP